MPQYRRAYQSGGTFFLTPVTHRRRPLFGGPMAVRVLRESLPTVRAERPLEVVAGVVLPDHLHVIWTLPDGDARRFWEHLVRDQDDRNQHLDYVHYNPVKHAHAACPHGYAASSFMTWVRRDVYPADWLCTCGDRGVRPPNCPRVEANRFE